MAVDNIVDVCLCTESKYRGDVKQDACRWNSRLKRFQYWDGSDWAAATGDVSDVPLNHAEITAPTNIHSFTFPFRAYYTLDAASGTNGLPLTVSYPCWVWGQRWGRTCRYWVTDRSGSLWMQDRRDWTEDVTPKQEDVAVDYFGTARTLRIDHDSKQVLSGFSGMTLSANTAVSPDYTGTAVVTAVKANLQHLEIGGVKILKVFVDDTDQQFHYVLETALPAKIVTGTGEFTIANVVGDGDGSVVGTKFTIGLKYAKKAITEERTDYTEWSEQQVAGRSDIDAANQTSSQAVQTSSAALQTAQEARSIAEDVLESFEAAQPYVEATWTLSSDIAVNGFLSLPEGVSYIGGKHHMLVHVDGVSLSPRWWEETVGDGVAGHSLKVKTKLKTGQEVHVWLSRMGYEDAAEYAALASAQADRATEQANLASGYHSQVQASASNAQAAATSALAVKDSVTAMKTSMDGYVMETRNAKVSCEGFRDEAAASASAASTAKGQAESARDSAAASSVSASSSKTAAETARDAAVSAKTAAESAKSASETAKASAEAAQVASESAQAAVESAKTATETARDEASEAKATAVSAKDVALSSKEGAVSAKNTAVAAKEDAESARDASQTAQVAAETARDEAVAAKDAAQACQLAACECRDAAEIAEENATATAESLRDILVAHESTRMYEEAYWMLESDIDADGVLSFPDGLVYIGGYHHIRLSVDGLVYSPRWWEETVETSHAGTSLKMKTSLRAGQEIHVWLSRIGYEEADDLVARAEDARAEAVSAKVSAESARDTALVAEEGAVSAKASTEEALRTASSTLDALEAYATRISTLEESMGRVFLDVYPVGSMFATMSGDNPGDLFGGTWTLADSYVNTVGWQSYSWTNSKYIGTSQSSYTPNKWCVVDNVLFVICGAGATAVMNTTSEDEVARIPIVGTAYTDAVWTGAVGGGGAYNGLKLIQGAKYLSVALKPHLTSSGHNASWASTFFSVPLGSGVITNASLFTTRYIWRRTA